MEPETYAVDREGWPPGPWDGEPDRVDFVHAGFACLLLRGTLGQWCGYVGVPETHPAFEKPHWEMVALDVHCGVNYAEKCSGVICHVPQPGMPDNVWWLGFDCGHIRDICPEEVAIEKLLGLPHFDFPGAAYRDVAYVRRETESLAAQLRQAATELVREDLPVHANSVP